MDEYVSRDEALLHSEIIRVYTKDYGNIDVVPVEYLADIPAADVQPVDRWISVKDRLPEAVEEDVNGKIAYSDFVLVYLVCDDGFTYITNDKCRVDNKSWLHEIPGEGCKVTHWMPLPKPPKDGDAE